MRFQLPKTLADIDYQGELTYEADTESRQNFIKMRQTLWKRQDVILYLSLMNIETTNNR